MSEAKYCPKTGKKLSKMTGRNCPIYDPVLSSFDDFKHCPTECDWYQIQHHKAVGRRHMKDEHTELHINTPCEWCNIYPCGECQHLPDRLFRIKFASPRPGRLINCCSPYSVKCKDSEEKNMDKFEFTQEEIKFLLLCIQVFAQNAVMDTELDNILKVNKKLYSLLEFKEEEK